MLYHYFHYLYSDTKNSIYTLGTCLNCWADSMKIPHGQEISAQHFRAPTRGEGVGLAVAERHHRQLQQLLVVALREELLLQERTSKLAKMAKFEK